MKVIGGKVKKVKVIETSSNEGILIDGSPWKTELT